MMIEEMNQKIESLQLEVASLQNALIDANKSSLANDTGYADFLGAVDSKDVEHQRNLKERNELNEKLQRELDDMKQNINELKNEKKDIESKISALLYENNEMKDKLTGVEKIMSEQVISNILTFYFRFNMLQLSFRSSSFSKNFAYKNLLIKSLHKLKMNECSKIIIH